MKTARKGVTLRAPYSMILKLLEGGLEPVHEVELFPGEEVAFSLATEMTISRRGAIDGLVEA